MRKRASCGLVRHQRPSARSRRSRPSSPAGPRSHPTSWSASSAISAPPRRRPRSSAGHCSSCMARGRPARTVPNPQPEGRPALPSGHKQQPSSTLEVPSMDTIQRTTPYEVITDRILALLEQGTVPWRQPWDSATGMPRNLFSQRSYRGINVWLLTAMGYASPFWATFQQVTAAGGSVRKGARGVPVVFWKVYTKKDQETGDEEKRFVLRQYTVFNAAQLDGVAVPAIAVTPHCFTPIERCAQLVEAMPQRPTIVHGHQQAFYTPATDTLHMPIPACFQDAE